MQYVSVKKALMTTAVLALGACQSVATSHELVTADKRHWAVQISMGTGVPGTPIQTVMLVYNKYSKTPRAIVEGNSKMLGDRLLDAVLNLGPAALQGSYILKAAKAECPAGTICGTLVQVSNQAGASADSSAAANGS